MFEAIIGTIACMGSRIVREGGILTSGGLDWERGAISHFGVEPATRRAGTLCGGVARCGGFTGDAFVVSSYG